MTRGDDGLWTASVSVAESGPVLVHVAVSRPGMPVAAVATEWTVGPVPGTQAGGPTLTRVVVIGIAGLVVTWLLVLLVEAAIGTRRRDDEPVDASPLAEDAESVPV
jgi:hypothetical protein